MLRIFRGSRYANVTSTIALVVALGGTTAYAANTISSGDINNGQVKSADIVTGQVKNADLAGNAVTSSKVRNGVLLAKDFKAGQLPAGATGATGAAGAKGDPEPFVTTLPSGKTETGAYIMRGTAAAAGARDGADISFSIPLAAAPTAHFIDIGGPAVPECPGSAAVPTAAPGHLCIYESIESNLTGPAF